MRTLNRNKKKFFYATYEGIQPIKKTDEYGNELDTGEYSTIHSEPQACYGNISPASGSSAVEVFGTTDGYDRVIIIDSTKIPIDENSLLWIDVDCWQEHDYIVKRVARSLNSVSVACRKVNVSE